MKYVILSIVMLTTAFAFGQVSVQFNYNRGFLFTERDLWDMSISNQGAPMEGVLEVKVTDIRLNPVLQARSLPVKVGNGINSINFSTVSVRELVISNGKYHDYISRYKGLPEGKYVYSVRLINLSGTPIADDAVEISVNPLSQPALVSPFDNETIYSTFPLLTWIPPTPANPGYSISYNIKLVELLPNQSPQEAIKRNNILFGQDHISPTQIRYPSNAVPLVTDRVYAWQITCFVNDEYFAETEIWAFTLGKQLPDTSAKPTTNESGSITYAQLAQSGSTTCYTTAGGKLHFSYVEKYLKGVLNYHIYDDKNMEQTPNLKIKKKYGENFITIDLKKEGGFVVNKVYQLVVVNDKMESYKLSFKYQE